MLAQRLIKRRGTPAMRKRKNIATMEEYDEPATYSADSIIGFQAIVDTRKRTSHRREPEGDVEDIDLRLLCYYDDTGAVADISATKFADGQPDQIHFQGAYDVLNVEDMNHAMTKDHFFGVTLRRREHFKTVLTIDALYAYVFGGNFDIDLTFSAEDAEVMTGKTVYAEVLIAGSWNAKTLVYVSGSKWRFTGIDWAVGDYKLRVRYDGSDDREGKIVYQNITIVAA